MIAYPYSNVRVEFVVIDMRHMTNEHPNHPWTRYVALGDSFTEGIGDPEPESVGGNRGWADRVAEVLTDGQPDFSYANLAVRGKPSAERKASGRLVEGQITTNWNQALAQLAIAYPDRINPYL